MVPGTSSVVLGQDGRTTLGGWLVYRPLNLVKKYLIMVNRLHDVVYRFPSMATDF